MVYLFYTTYISVDLAHHEIFRAKVGKGGINWDVLCFDNSVDPDLIISRGRGLVGLDKQIF